MTDGRIHKTILAKIRKTLFWMRNNTCKNLVFLTSKNKVNFIFALYRLIRPNDIMKNLSILVIFSLYGNAILLTRLNVKSSCFKSISYAKENIMSWKNKIEKLKILIVDDVKNNLIALNALLKRDDLNIFWKISLKTSHFNIPLAGFQ